MKCECGNARFSVECREMRVGTAYVDGSGDLCDVTDEDTTGWAFLGPYKCTQCKKEYEEFE